VSERLSIGLIALSLALATMLGTSTTSDDVFVDWARHDLHLDEKAAACVSRQLPAGGLAPDPGIATLDDLAQHGLDALAPDRRQLAGDIVIACVLSTEKEP